MRPSQALAWASHTLCDSNSTCRMTFVPRSCGLAKPIYAIRMAALQQPLTTVRGPWVPQPALHLGRLGPHIRAQPCVEALTGRSPLMGLQ